MKNLSPSPEFDRLIELSEFDLDYSALEKKLDDLTELVTIITGKEISLINLIDNHTTWSVSSKGLDLHQMPREDTVCEYTIQNDQPLEIPDLKADERFNYKDYVRSGPNLQYYYGVPLTTSNGYNIGTLCVFDPKKEELSDKERQILGKIANQVVQRLEEQQQIKKLENEVRSVYQSKREVSHDIRNPVFGMIGIAHVMEEQIEEQNFEELPSLVDLIIQGGNTLIEMADDILRDEKSEGENKPAEHEFSCELLCQKLNELYQPQARTKNVHLSIQSADNSDPLHFPKSRLLQITGNLIANSIKFTDSGGRVDVQIKALETEKNTEQNKLFITVEDTGVGMPPEKIEEIKNKSAKSHLGTQGETGFGFGLTLVDHLIQKALGSWDITSEEGKGCKFVIELPI